MGFTAVITHAGCWENTKNACRLRDIQFVFKLFEDNQTKTWLRLLFSTQLSTLSLVSVNINDHGSILENTMVFVSLTQLKTTLSALGAELRSFEVLKLRLPF